VFEMTGPAAPGVVPMVRGVTECANWINNKGGIDVKGEKYKINLIIVDSKGTPDGGINAANRLVFKDKVKYIVGEVFPFMCEAVRSISDPNKVLYFTSQYDLPNPAYPYTLSATYPYIATKPVLYDYLVKAYPNVKKVAMSHQDEAGNTRAALAAEKEISKHGLQLTINEVYPFATSDHLALATKMVGTNPDAVDFNMEFTEGGADFVKCLRQTGFKGPILQSTGPDVNAVIPMVGNPAYATDWILPTFDPAKVRAGSVLPDFLKLWGNAYHVPFMNDAIRGWNPLYCLVQSIQKAQSLDPTDVVKAFTSMRTIDTVEGTAKVGGLKTFGFNGTVLEPCPLTRVMNGKPEFVGWYKTLDY